MAEAVRNVCSHASRREITKPSGRQLHVTQYCKECGEEVARFTRMGALDSGGGIFRDFSMGDPQGGESLPLKGGELEEILAKKQERKPTLPPAKKKEYTPIYLDFPQGKDPYSSALISGGDFYYDPAKNQFRGSQGTTLNPEAFKSMGSMEDALRFLMEFEKSMQREIPGPPAPPAPTRYIPTNLGEQLEEARKELERLMVELASIESSMKMHGERWHSVDMKLIEEAQMLVGEASEFRSMRNGLFELECIKEAVEIIEHLLSGKKRQPEPQPEPEPEPEPEKLQDAFMALFIKEWDSLPDEQRIEAEDTAARQGLCVV